MNEFVGQIVTSLKNQIIPWQNLELPVNIFTKNRFTGISPLILNISSRKNNFKSPFWGTFDQWQRLGFSLKNATSQGTRIPVYKPGFWGTMSVWTLFNSEQVANFTYKTPAIDYDLAESIINGSKAKIIFREGSVCVYNYPPEDNIIFPLKEQFLYHGVNGYYYSLFHELTHHSEPRLNWDYQDVPKNEMRAEMGASYLSAYCNIKYIDYNKNKTHRTYCDGWMERIANEPNFIFKMSESVDLAFNFIIKYSNREKSNGPEKIVA